MKGSEPRPYRQSKRAADVAAMREHLLRTARAALAERDGNLALDAIAARAGVGRPTIYRHFGTRAALFSAVVEQMSTRHDLAAGLARALDAPEDRDALVGFVRVATGLWIQETDLIRGALRMKGDLEIAAVLASLDRSRKRDAQRVARRVQPRVPAPDVVSALMMLTSPESFLYLVDDLGLAPAKAARTLAGVAGALVKGGTGG